MELNVEKKKEKISCYHEIQKIQELWEEKNQHGKAIWNTDLRPLALVGTIILKDGEGENSFLILPFISGSERLQDQILFAEKRLKYYGDSIMEMKNVYKFK